MKQPYQFLFLVLFLSSTYLYSQKTDSLNIDKNDLLTERFIFSAGIFIPSKSIKIGVNGKTPNNVVDLGKAMDLDHREGTLTLNFFWRFSKSKNWSVALEYFATKNSQQKILEKEIDWGDTSIPAGAKADVGVGLNLYRILFGRVVTKGKKHELIAGIGIHALDINSYVQAIAYVGEQDVDLDIAYNYDKHPVELIAPVPNIGIKFLYTPTEKWGIGARIDWFSLNTSKYSGYLWNLGPSVSYQLFNNFGLGATYRYFNTSLDVKERFWKGSADLVFHGPLFFVNFNF